MCKLSLSIAAGAALMLSGCTAMDVVTLPVKVAKTGVNAVSSGVDAVTTSQAEADQKRGRDIRRREERMGELARDYDKLARACAEGKDAACREAVQVRAEMDQLAPGVPVEPAQRR